MEAHVSEVGKHKHFHGENVEGVGSGLESCMARVRSLVPVVYSAHGDQADRRHGQDDATEDRTRTRSSRQWIGEVPAFPRAMAYGHKLGEGATEADLLDAYPRLTKAEIQAVMLPHTDRL